ncbi:integrase catalytic domain-containing protein [Trichonephila clavipes]|nr:integrase catalytic domain-containing protein [Trichonephila clavipes]
MSRHAKNIMKEAGMEMRKWIINDTVLMAQWAAEGFDTHPMDASIRKIFDPLGLLTLYYKNKMSHTEFKKSNWDEILPPKVKVVIIFKELPLLDNLRIPRLVLDSTNDEVSDPIEIHIFCDASKLAYGAAAYVKVRKQNEVLKSHRFKNEGGTPESSYFARLELLGALVAARLS